MPVDIYPVAERLLLETGYDVDLDTGPECDRGQGSSACSLSGTNESARISVHLFNPGDADGNVPLSDPSRSLVVVSVIPD
jgi:hypothetical protein